MMEVVRTRPVLIVIDEPMDHVVAHCFCRRRTKRGAHGLGKRDEGAAVEFVLRQRSL